MELRRVLLLLAGAAVFLLLAALPAAAQSITDYSMTPSSGTYTPLAGATVVTLSGSSPYDDGYANGIPIGFSFDFNGTAYTTVSVTTNGCLFPGATLTSSVLSNSLTSGTPRPVIAPLWDDLEIDTSVGGNVSYLTTGSAGSRVFTMQWSKVMWRYNTQPVAVSFQTKIYEADSKIEFVYFDEGGATGNTPTASIGLAAVATGSGNFLSLDGTGTNPGVSSTVETTSLSSKPASGQTYAWSRSPMTYNSSTTTQNTAAVPQGAVNAQIIGIQVQMDGAISPLSITQFNLSTTGSTSASDIVNAKLYYTGTSSTFAATGQFGSTVNSPGGAFSITGSQTLSGGTNYFWLTYDVSATATVGNVLDAECTQITVAATPHVPTITAPAGNRQILAAMNGTYTIDPGGGGGTNYTTFTSAVADLNSRGIAGPVTFNVKAGAVFTGALSITATGTVSRPIVFQRSGAGANPVVQDSGTSSTTDAVIKLVGSDYITFDGIDVIAPGSVTTQEWGYYFLGSATDGCQNNTVKNCLIDLNRLNTNARGVYLSSFATAASGANSNNKFYNNVIADAYVGYWFAGATAAPDDGNEIGTVSGGTSLVRGLGGSTISSYGVYYGYQTTFKVFNTTIDSIATTSGTIGGIYNSGGSTNTVEITNNTIKDFSTTSGTIYGIYGGFSGTTYSVHGNDVRGFTSGGSSLYGMYHGGGTTISIYRNLIHDISYTGSSTSTIYGVYTAGGTTQNIYNNFIYDLRGAGSTSTTPISGIYVSSGTTINLYFNSVLLNYVSTSASNQSTALYVSSTPTTVDMRNNIFVNTVDVTTGTRASAFRKSSTVLTNISATTNNNLYYAGTPSATRLIFYDGTNSDQTLAAYKARIAPRDQAAVTENPPFLSTSTPYNLHMNTAVQTQTESGGTPVTSPIAITDDIDGNTRNATTPDIGGDEFNGIALDVTPPQITYAPLGNSIATPTRTLTTTISDAVSGVQKSAAGKPRVYFKKGAAGVYSTGSGTESPANTWTFTIDQAAIGATAVNDTVYYYVAAQDSSSNAGTNPIGTSPTINPPNATVASPNFYRIAAAFSGNVTIGSGAPELATFPTVKAFFDSVNASVVTGAVTATLTSSVTESAPAVLNAVAYGAGGPFTITLKPAPATVDTITGSATGAILQLNGADNVVIDGSNSGGTDRSLAILHTGTSGGSAAIALTSSGAGLGASSNTLKNLVLACGAAQSTGTTETFGIFAGGATIGTSSDGADNDNLTVQNTAIQKVRWGIYVRGTAGNLNTGTLISGNVVGPDSFGVDEIGRGGIVLQYQDGATVTQNVVRYVGGTYALTSSGSDRVGIGLGAGDGWPGATGTDFRNGTVTRNLIHDIVDERTYSAIGIGLAAAGTGTGNIVANNMMYNLRANGTAGDMTVGLCLAAGDGDRVVYNSMLLTGDLDPAGGPTSASVSSAGIRIVSTSVTNLTLKNNIADVDFSSNTSTLKHYAIIAPATSFAWGTGGANNNDYFVNAANTQMVLGGIGTTTPFTDVATLAAWRTQFTPNQDGASVSGDPQFVSATNLHIAGVSVVANAGTAIPGVTTDFDGDTRSVSTPDIGADEFLGGGTVVSVSLTPGWNMISNPVTTSADSVRQLFPTSSFAYVFSFAGAGGYQQQYRMLNTAGYWGKFPGATTASISGNPRTRDSVTVTTGWNLVGSISSAIDTATITSVPPGIRSSTAWFGYNVGYTPSQFITPGYAYWVKVSAPGRFIFSSGPAPEKSATPRRSITDLSSLTLTDSRGGSQILYFGLDVDGSLAGLDYELPPAPPAGQLDARFIDADRGLLVRTLPPDAAGADFPIALRTDALPLTVSWKIAAGEADMTYRLADGTGGTAFASIPMQGEGRTTLTRSGLSRLVLQAGNSGMIPREFALMQNYPNPFNPSTTISFALPSPARVTLEVFNVLGQRVALLINNEERKAGFQTVEWNGTGPDGLAVGSGVYFVRYTAAGATGVSFTDVRKMMLMK